MIEVAVGNPFSNCLFLDGYRTPRDPRLVVLPGGMLPHNMIKIGCQGWNYTDWISRLGAPHVFYPEGTRQNEMFQLYASVFDAVEIDSTFYATPGENAVAGWMDRSPDGFLFCPKMPGAITHEAGLKESSIADARLFCTRMSALGDKLGPILIQLPPTFRASKKNAKRLMALLDALSSDFRFVVEFRDPRWIVNWTLRMLSEKGAGLCVTEGEWISRDLNFSAIDSIESGPLYVRFMGSRDLDSFDRVVRPQNELLEIWADKLSERADLSQFVFFSNLFEGFAPASVNKLRELKGLDPRDPDQLRIQEKLF